MLLSCLSIAGEAEQRKLVGCGISHVCLTLSDSLLCYSLTHSPHSLQEMCDSSASVLSPNPLPHFFLFFIIYPNQPSLDASRVYHLQICGPFFFQKQMAFEQVEGRPTGKRRNKRMRTLAIPVREEVTVRPAHPTPVPWRQGGRE